MEPKALPDISTFSGIEFSVFKLKQGVPEPALLAAVEQMVEGLYAGEEGFLGHAILKGADDIYVDVLFANSAKWGSGPFAEACLSYLEKIEEGSARLAFFQRIK